jgi:hypothetical protein
MFRALDEAAYAQGAQREDTLFAAAHAIAATNEIGRLSNAEGYDQLLRAAEHNGLSRELRWFQIEPYLRAALTRKANSSMGRSK